MPFGHIHIRFFYSLLILKFSSDWTDRDLMERGKNEINILKINAAWKNCDQIHIPVHFSWAVWLLRGFAQVRNALNGNISFSFSLFRFYQRQHIVSKCAPEKERKKEHKTMPMLFKVLSFHIITNQYFTLYYIVCFLYPSKKYRPNSLR